MTNSIMSPRLRLLARLRRSTLLVPLAILVGWGCRAQQKNEGTASAQNAPATTEAASRQPTAPSVMPRQPGLPPLTGIPWLVNLSDDKNVLDLATPPLGTTEPRPVVVAVHGAGDRPDWSCGGWRIGLQEYAFVACPMGLRMGQRTFGWSGVQSIETAVERSLSELRTRFGPYLRSAPMIFAGFSQGAMLAGPFLIAHAKEFPVAALAEGGLKYLTDPRFARDYLNAGGRRILIVCGSPACFVTAAHAKATLEKAGLTAIVSGDPLSGHNLNTRMQDALKRDWPKLVGGLPGWETFKGY